MPGIKRVRTHADEFKDLHDHAPIEFDPEDDAAIEQSGSDDSASADEQDLVFSGREHYQPVAKSNLRQRDSAALGPQYAGSRVARQSAAAADEEHDPFAEYGSEEDSEMDDIVDDESEGQDEEDEIEGEDESADHSEDGDAGTDNTSISDGEDEDEDMQTSRLAKDGRAELRRIMNEQSNVAASINEATKLDAEKGRAVKRQRKTFDSLLNARIRMQQSLIAVNSMQAVTADAPQNDPKEAYAGAENAALTLWNTLDSLRHSFASQTRSSDTTSNPPPLTIDASTAPSKIWTHMQAREAAALPLRNSTLDKWSRKTASASAHLQQAATRRLGPDATGHPQAQHDTITAVLADHLSPANLPRLLARTRVPRSCAPVQAATAPPKSQTTTTSTSADANTTDDTPSSIYDDADFYAHLLQDLLSQRQLDDLSAPLAPDAALTQQYRAARAASKTKRAVDTRASKGRKMRYTVHEKLQNFMAPEDRGEWGLRQREELFGSLLGRRMGLDEREGEVDGDGEREGDGHEEEALMLFRS